jgi:hypothetical protein
MNQFKRPQLYLIIILLLTLISFKIRILYKDAYNDELFNQILKMEDDKISIVINFKNLTKNKHILFYEFMKKLNSTRNFYFIKTLGKPLDENLNNIVKNSFVKIVQSNFPDSIFLPLIISLYGNTIPELVLFIEGDELMDNIGNNLINWVDNAYKQIKENQYDYIFGNSQIIKGKKIGCSLLLSKSSIIEYLLYYTDSDTSHANPFIQLSLATQTNFCFIPFNYIKSSNLEATNNRFSLNMNCPSINDTNLPSLCIILPNFKRNYFSSSFPAFSNQTYKPKLYIIIQNENRIYYNLTLIQKMVNEPVYHIWMQNWNSFFFLNLRLSSLLPCDFILKYDDDQWPIDNTLQQRLISNIKGKNAIIGYRGFSVEKSFCEYSPKDFNKVEDDVVDHSAVPLITRPGYIKLDARNKIYRLYGGEDISLSLNSRKLCNVTSKIMKMKLMEMQKDGNNQRADKHIISAYKNEKDSNFDLFSKTYCYLIHSGYIPRRWAEFQIPQKDYLNITIKHKRLN